jgi:glyoxylase-like metal-dependent hydrolase (beta-lactamase superfamily II)
MEAIGDGIWYVRGPDFRLPGGARMPLGSTVARLADRTLLIYAPIAFDAAGAAAIDATGAVAHVVAPNLLHHLFVADALQRWPRAAFHAPPALADKRPDLPPARPLDVGDPALDAVHLAGAPTVDETVLFHRPSRTLLCGDLVFHLGRAANLRSRLLFGLMGVGGGLAQSRAWRFFRRDRAALRTALDQVLAWPIAQVAPCHGDPTPVTADELRAVMRRAYG